MAEGEFAVVPLLRATAGLFAAVSFAVTRRRHELGVRSALGTGRGALPDAPRYRLHASCHAANWDGLIR